ncbi:acyl-phosphate glycerol 3-phosphate acyltransferase [Agrococcus sediminis]|uniref:Acyl-phosphate glycerol 3-phosphate acyltransferase n=1 Tax=Agrococcus sediminis TaxID=2599924 RepID=A0A5M8QGJ0_9MICO|nr:1-acyl-sn-glycerol-3-phosphate acyltransferase [Agrococcus sediminis]KAA6435177.1 acyl-phosphate glycerol 3-phosphate acyltransferase [Agrococcus sediminis]
MTGGSSRRQPVRHAIAQLHWRLSPWRLVREQPAHVGPRLLIGAPHTSNRDFVLMLAITWDARLPVRWLGKRELFQGPFGGVMHWLGGIPVDRDDPAGLVERVVELVRHDPRAAIVVTPDGTRSSTHWRSGFYRIAYDAGIPVTLGFVDSITGTTGLGPTIRLTGDVPTDMDRIRAFYAGKAGINPERTTEPRLADEAGLAARLAQERLEP